MLVILQGAAKGRRLTIVLRWALMKSNGKYVPEGVKNFTNLRLSEALRQIADENGVPIALVIIDIVLSALLIHLASSDDGANWRFEEVDRGLELIFASATNGLRYVCQYKIGVECKSKDTYLLGITTVIKVLELDEDSWDKIMKTSIFRTW